MNEQAEARIAELLKALEAIAAGNIGGIAASTPRDVIQAYKEVARGAIARDNQSARVELDPLALEAARRGE